MAVGSSQSHVDLLGMPGEGEWKKQVGAHAEMPT
jgi:hypothetical protein